jgi:hypothetical protein
LRGNSSGPWLWDDGRVHKYGQSTDGGEHWDVWDDTDGTESVWEHAPSFGWEEAGADMGHTGARAKAWCLLIHEEP